MRGLARFKSMRTLVASTRSALQAKKYHQLLDNLENDFPDSYFSEINPHEFLHELKKNGISFGLKLQPETTKNIRDWTTLQLCYADRQSNLGFHLKDRKEAEKKLGKPILLAQYFNTTTGCQDISKLATDPILNWISAKFLGSMPTFVGANLWWTFPVTALESDREKHAHIYHRDVDDFRFIKFFFYLTDVPAGDGGHVCVLASHKTPPLLRKGDRWNIRRYSDDEINNTYSTDLVHEIFGPSGTGFAENTLCIHKGSTPHTEARLLLQLQFALFDYGVTDDHRALQTLTKFI